MSACSHQFGRAKRPRVSTIWLKTDRPGGTFTEKGASFGGGKVPAGRISVTRASAITLLAMLHHRGEEHAVGGEGRAVVPARGGQDAERRLRAPIREEGWEAADLPGTLDHWRKLSLSPS